MSEIVYKEQFKKIPDGYGYNGPNQTLELQKYKDKINKKIFSDFNKSKKLFRDRYKFSYFNLKDNLGHPTE